MGEAISEVNYRAHLADERGPGDSKCAGHVFQNSAPLTRLNTLGERAERQSLYGDPHWKGVVCHWQILALEVLARLITVVGDVCLLAPVEVSQYAILDSWRGWVPWLGKPRVVSQRPQWCNMLGVVVSERGPE